MSTNAFRPRKFEDFEIVDEEERVVGHVRVKPSGILWAPKSSKRWFGVHIDDFAKYMEENGKRQKK